MKNMGKIMKEAHRLTREIKGEFPEVDYKTQLGICISYLLAEKEDLKVETERIEELKKELNIAEDEAKQLVQVEKHYQSEYARDGKVGFNIWEGYGKRRAYITLPWRSKNANFSRNNYDFNTKYLQDRYYSKQF